MKRICCRCLPFLFLLYMVLGSNGCAVQDSHLRWENGKQVGTAALPPVPDRPAPPVIDTKGPSAGIEPAANEPSVLSSSGKPEAGRSLFGQDASARTPAARHPGNRSTDSFLISASEPELPSGAFRDRPDEADTQEAVFNFEEADLREVIRTMADILSIDYILDSDVKGTVTIHTSGALDQGDIFDIFLQILELNGLTAIREGNLYKITSIKDSSRMSLLARYGRDAAGIDPDQKVMIQVIPLSYIAAQEMTKLLEPFMSANGTLISHDDSNTLMVVDRAVNIYKVLKLIDVFDVDIFEKIGHRFYTIRNIPVEEMADLLRDILSAYGRDEKSGVRLIEINRMNQLLILSEDPKLFSEIEKFLLQLDVAGEGVEPRIYVYSVKNGEAEELGQLLTSVFSGKGPSAAELPVAEAVQPKESNPFAPPDPFEKPASSEKPTAVTRPPAEIPVPPGAPTETRGSATLRGEVAITSDSIRNALIIEATPSDYLVIRDILEQIDVLPRQVLIRVVIAEISLDGREELGVEWSYKKGPGDLSTSLLNAQMGSSGLQFAVGQADRWSAALSALAQDNKVNVLSTPTVLASDNKEAKINVSTKVPVASAEYIFDSGVSGVTQTNIQYRDTGIILSVTPHINERGLVSMELQQEVSEQGGGVEVGGQNFPSFRERSVNTTLTVKNGQTIIMGGLMTEREEKGNSGVPFFSKLPVIGFLFGRDTKEFSKNELILLITPQVINTLDEVDSVTEEFQKRIKEVQMNLG